MVSLRTLSVGLAIVTGLGGLLAASPAKADWDGHHGWHGQWHHHGWHGRWHRDWHRWGPRAYYYAPPPPPVVYAPPPVYYAPPPVYYPPGVSFGVTFH